LSQNIKAFIIHLDRARERNQHIVSLQNSIPMATQIIEAIDSDTLDHAAIAAVYRRRLHRPYYPFRLSACEIACFLSHRKAWQAIVDLKLEAALVMEDDVALTAEFAAILAFARQHITAKSFIRFPFRCSEKGTVEAQTAHIRLIRPTPVGLGQVAQIIGYDAARQLLAATRYFDRPVDTLLQLFWITGVRPYSLLPGGVSEISAQLGGSTLKKQRKFKEKLYREIMRPLYRNKIAVLSKKKD